MHILIPKHSQAWIDIIDAFNVFWKEVTQKEVDIAQSYFIENQKVMDPEVIGPLHPDRLHEYMKEGTNCLATKIDQLMILKLAYGMTIVKTTNGNTRRELISSEVNLTAEIFSERVLL